MIPRDIKPFDAQQFRMAFPALNGKAFYLDSASTALKPNAMIEASLNYYTHETATALRSKHSLAISTTQKITQAREYSAQLINAKHSSEIIWTRGATESLNIVTQAYAQSILKAGDEIIVSELEHHSNLIPWLMAAKKTGAKVVKWPIEQDGSLANDRLLTLISSNTKIVAVTQMSNVTGFQPDIAGISQIAHQHNAIIVVDGAQGIAHQAIDVQKLDIDFYAFSAHKLYGPTGLGVLYGKTALLEQMDCYHGGGKMLTHASFDGFTVAELPSRFEAGTPNIAGIVGFYATLQWLQSFNHAEAENYTRELGDYAKSQLARLPGVNLYSKAGPLVTLTIDGVHHDDIAILLAEQDIAIRTGELCAQPLIKALGCNGVIRVSLMPYNNKNDIDYFISALQNALSILE